MATSTFDPSYISNFSNSIQDLSSSNPALASNMGKFGKVTDEYGNPLFDQTTYANWNDPQTQKYVSKTLDNWADTVLQNNYIDPSTNKKINWESVGGINSSAYNSAKQQLLGNPENNPRWTAQENKIAADKALAEAKTAQDVADAQAAKEKADAEAIAAAANEKAITEKDLADQAALKKENELKLQTATAPLDVKKIGGGFDAAGNLVSSNITAGITQEDINKGLLNIAKVGQAQTITNPNSAADVSKMVDAAKAVDVNVTPDSLVSNRLAGLLGKNNPYIQQAVNAANLQASRRGMLNTGAAAGFATDAAIKAALPIAQQDAATIQKANEANAAAANQLLNTGVSLKATSLDRQAQNDIQVQNWNAANKISVDTTNTNAVNDAVKIFTTAMLNDKVNGASDARKNADTLRQLITSGNIDIAKKAADATIAELAANRTLENDKQLAVFNNSLSIALESVKADLQHTRDVFVADADMTKAANAEIADLNAKFNASIQALNLTPDLTGAAKAAIANNMSIKFYQDQQDVYNRYTSFSSLVNSDAGKTAAALVSSTK